MKTKIYLITGLILLLSFISAYAQQHFKAFSDLNTIQMDKNFFKISPNPTRDNLKLLLQNTEQELIEVRVYNVLGHEVLKKNYVNYPDDIILELSDFDKGIYVLNVKVNNWNTSQKFLIN